MYAVDMLAKDEVKCFCSFPSFLIRKINKFLGSFNMLFY